VVTPPPLIAAPDTPPPRAGAGGAASSAVAPVLASPSFSPLYQQIKTLILRSLQNGEWRPGEAIPSEIDLAARFKVSQGTVRKAVDELAAENLLVRRQGKGTFVATHAEEQVQYRFLRLASAALHLRPEDSVVEVRRVLHFTGQPVVLDDIWLPAHLFKGLTAERLSEYRGPMYGLFESEFGVLMICAEEKLRAVSADEGGAALLKVAARPPLLRVKRLAFTYGDQPVELRRGPYRTDRHYYRNELS